MKQTATFLCSVATGE